MEQNESEIIDDKHKRMKSGGILWHISVGG